MERMDGARGADTSRACARPVRHAESTHARRASFRVSARLCVRSGRGVTRAAGSS
jgi:hypothetical protein